MNLNLFEWITKDLMTLIRLWVESKKMSKKIFSSKNFKRERERERERERQKGYETKGRFLMETLSNLNLPI